ncbi:MAG: WD40/YVTN/BNR-like repeat-containing protein [Bacteroidota bacterium]
MSHLYRKSTVTSRVLHALAFVRYGSEACVSLRQHVRCWVGVVHLLFSFLFIVSADAQGSSTVGWIAPKPQGSTLNRIIFQNNQSAWIVGDCGTIMHSRDGGSTWRLVPSGTSSDLKGITFANDEIGWIVGDNGTMLKTTDGGSLWEVVPSLVETGLTDVAFQDENNGVVTGEFGVVLRTTDGGSHWYFARYNDPRDYNRIVLGKDLTGVIIASDGTISVVDKLGPVFPEVEKLCKESLVDAAVSADGKSVAAISRSGGIFVANDLNDLNDWSEYELPAGTSCASVAMIGRGRFLIATETELIYLQPTSENSELHIDLPPPTMYIRSIVVRDDSTAFGVGVDGAIVRIDLMSYRATLSTQYNLPLLKRVAFLDQNNGLALAQDGRLYLTTDAGSTWLSEGQAPILKRTSARGVRFISKDVGIALSDEGLLVTRNGGEEWKPVRLPAPLEALSIGTLTPGRVWFSGYGFIGVSKRGGNTIELLISKELHIPSEEEISDAFESSAVKVVVKKSIPFADTVEYVLAKGEEEWGALCRNGSRFYTNDGGREWKYIDRGSQEVDPISELFGSLLQMRETGVEEKADQRYPRSTQFFSSAVGWILLGHGVALKTMNGGLSWEKEELPTNDDLTSVSFLSDSDGWVGTSKGRIFSTRDGGLTWHVMGTGISGNIKSLQFITPLFGWAVDAAGKIYSTEDGGENWTERFLPSYQRIADIVLDPSGGAVWVAQGNSLKIFTSASGQPLAPIKLPIKGGVQLLGIGADSCVFFMSSMGEVGSISLSNPIPYVFPSALPTTAVNSIAGPDQFHPVLVGPSGLVIRLNPNTEKWRETMEVTNYKTINDFTAIQFLDSHSGIIGATSGRLYVIEIENGGFAIHEQPLSTFSTIRDIEVSVSHNNIVWATGDNGTLLASNDGGHSWKSIVVPFNEAIIGVQFLPPDLLFIYTRNGKLICSSTFDLAVKER